jgi:Double-GTPase 1
MIPMEYQQFLTLPLLLIVIFCIIAISCLVLIFRRIISLSKATYRPIKVIMLGGHGVGKTAFLSTQYNQWMTTGDECFILETDSNDDRNALVKSFNTIPAIPPTLIADTKEWPFVGYVTAGGRKEKLIEINYLDYAGEILDLIFENRAPSGFEEELKNADVLLGFLDGHQLLKLMDTKKELKERFFDKYSFSKLLSKKDVENQNLNIDIINFNKNLEKILYLMDHRKDRKQPIYFLITKWDELDGIFTLEQVLDCLNGINIFKSFIEGQKWRPQIRLIPISCFGKNFVQRDKNGKMVRTGQQNIPHNVKSVLVCILIDVFASNDKQFSMMFFISVLLRLLSATDLSLNIFPFISINLKIFRVLLEYLKPASKSRTTNFKNKVSHRPITEIHNKNHALEYTIFKFMNLIDKLGREFPDSKIIKGRDARP